MKTARRFTIAAIFLAASAFATSIHAQSDLVPATEPVLKAIPDNSLGFILVKNLAQADKAISKLAAVVQAPLPSVLSLFKSQAGIQEGLDENGSAAIALLPGPAAINTSPPNHPPAPLPVVLFPVTDYKKFIAQFQPDDVAAETTGVTIAGHALIVGRKDSFAVFTLPDHKEQLTKLIASMKGVDSLLGSIEPWIGRHQISVVATPSGSKMIFQAGAAGLKQVQAILAAQPNAQQVATASMAIGMYQSVLTKASREVDLIGVGLNLDDSSNLSIDSHTSFVAGGGWASAMKGLKPWEGKRFTGIQTSSIVVAFEGIWPEKWSDGFAHFSGSAMSVMSKQSGGAPLDEQQRTKYVEALRSLMQGIRSMSFVMSPPKPGGSFYDGTEATMKVDDAPSFLTRYQESIEQMNQITKGLKNFPLDFSNMKKIEIDGHTGLAIVMDMSRLVGANNDPNTAKAMSAILGPNGKLTMRILTADDHTLIAAYGSEDHAKEVLAAYKSSPSSPASDPDLATTLALLPPHAQWVGLVSIKGYMDLIKGMLSNIGGPGASIKLPDLPAMPPIGFAAEASDTGLDTQLVVPSETIAKLSKVVRGTSGHAPAAPAP